MKPVRVTMIDGYNDGMGCGYGDRPSNPSRSSSRNPSRKSFAKAAKACAIEARKGKSFSKCMQRKLKRAK